MTAKSTPRRTRETNHPVKKSFTVVNWPIARVKPYAKNARQIPPDAVAKVAASIKAFGWRVPLVVDEKGVLLAGHTRLMAAETLGLAEVPVHVATGLTAVDARAYRLMDNRSHDETRWDLDALREELADLAGFDFDLGLTGFDPGEIERWGPGVGGAGDPEAAPEKPADPVTRPGELWRLGPHRLLCGDATSAADIERLLAGAAPHLMVTDPPYGVAYDPDWRNRVDRANGKPYGASAVGTVRNDDRADWREAWALFPGEVAYTWSSAGSRQAETHASLLAAGFEVRQEIVWVKSRHVIGRGHYHYRHEPCWYAVRKGARASWQGARDQDTVWEIEHRKSETGHGAQKPVECMRRPIQNNSRKGDAVYDPFLGSGTTLIAAEMMGRVCYALDIDPGYVDVAVRRWQDFTVRPATLDGDGRTFDDLAQDRAAARAA